MKIQFSVDFPKMILSVLWPFSTHTPHNSCTLLRSFIIHCVCRTFWKNESVHWNRIEITVSISVVSYPYPTTSTINFINLSLSQY